MTTLAAPGDTLRIAVENLTQRDGSDVEQAITADATGVANLYDWNDGELESGPHAMVQAGSGAKWYIDVDAPAEGHYRIESVITRGGARRTFYGELRVAKNTPT